MARWLAVSDGSRLCSWRVRANLKFIMQAAQHVPIHIDETARRPVVVGTDIKVSQIASEYEHLGMTPDQIVEAHPHLNLADVHAALVYYYDHRDVVSREWHEAETLMATLQARYPSRATGLARVRS
jgi:uncharacterized protein (DUF433 family)